MESLAMFSFECPSDSENRGKKSEILSFSYYFNEQRANGSNCGEDVEIEKSSNWKEIRF